MLTQRVDAIARFTRNDATRLGIAAVILILILTAVLGADILPQQPLDLKAGDLAPSDIVAPKTLTFESASKTTAAQAQARAEVEPQYDFTSDNAAAHRAGAAGRLREPRLARRHDLRGRPSVGAARLVARDLDPRPLGEGSRHARGAGAGRLAGPANRGGARARRARASGAARHRRRGDEDPARRADGRRSRPGASGTSPPSSSARWSCRTPRSVPSSPPRRRLAPSRRSRR